MIPNYRRIRESDGDCSQAWHAVCTRSDVIATVVPGSDVDTADANVEQQQQQQLLRLELRGQCGAAGAVNTFNVILYQGEYKATPRSLLQVVLHSCELTTVQTAVGHAANTTLSANVLPELLFSAGGPQLQCSTSARPGVLSVPAHLVAEHQQQGSHVAQQRGEQQLMGVQVGAKLEAAAAELGQHTWLVTLVGAEPGLRLGSRQAIWSWLVRAKVSLPPTIHRRYEAMGLPSDGSKWLKIKFENPHAEPRVYSLMTTLPRLLRFGFPSLAIPAKGVAFAELEFMPQPEGTLADVLVNLNDEAGQTESCVVVRACWAPPALD